MALDSYNPPQPHDPLRTWRQLPRLLVSRRWRWMTLGVIITTIGLISLGFWQLDRLEQRRARNRLIESRLTAPPLVLLNNPINIAQAEFRRVTLSGTFDSSQEVLLRNRTLDGQPGVDVLTPLRLANSDQYVLVDRGWIPLFQSDPQQRQAFAVSGPVAIEGVIRRAVAGTSSFSPQQDRQPAGGRLDAWFRPDVVKIDNQVPYDLLPFYVEQLPTADAPDLPRPQPNIDYQNEGSHWSYAIQWFSFATILACGYAAFVVTKTEQTEAEPDRSNAA